MQSYAHHYAVFWGRGGGPLFYSKGHTQHSCSIPRTYWSCVITAKTLRAVRLYVVFVELCAVFME